MSTSANSTRKKKPTNAVPSKSNVVNEEEEEEEEEDRINNLPEALLSQMLSLLTTEEALKTSVLSKRWRNLWTSITNLDFYDGCKIQPPTNFINYVNRILLLHNSPSIKKFSLRLSEFFDHFHVNKWISHAVTRNLRELELRIEDKNNEMELPSCVFYCKTLEVLKLELAFVFKIPKAKANSVCFPNLKVLHLNSVYCCELPEEEGFICFPVLKTLHLVCVVYERVDDSASKLVRNSPVLEDLYIKRTDEINQSNINMYAPSLRRAELDFKYQTNGLKVQIEAPTLQYLTISQWDLAVEFLMKESYSLIEAKLMWAFALTEKPDNAHKLIKAVDKAQCLFVSSDVVEAIEDGIGVFPLFCNLTRLEVEINCWMLSVLQCFLENSINLQYLVITKERKPCRVKGKWWTELASVPKCLLSTLKRVEIHDVVGCTDEVALIKYMLKNAKVLEKLTLQTCPMTNKYQLIQKISLFPRGYAECEVAFS